MHYELELHMQTFNEIASRISHIWDSFCNCVVNWLGRVLRWKQQPSTIPDRKTTETKLSARATSAQVNAAESQGKTDCNTASNIITQLDDKPQNVPGYVDPQKVPARLQTLPSETKGDATAQTANCEPIEDNLNINDIITQLGDKLQHVPGDGNCCVWSILAANGIKNATQQDVDNLRKSAAEHAQLQDDKNEVGTNGT